MARIVVIEDSRTNLDLMRYLLESYGHEVFSAGDGSEGLQLARTTMPQLIVCDIHLPKVDGYEVARQLKAHPILCKTPLVAVTAMATVADRDKGLESGFDAYIYKPIQPETFVADIESFIKST